VAETILIRDAAAVATNGVENHHLIHHTTKEDEIIRNREERRELGYHRRY
jgi:hypothetical protein